ncbi:hypothetical protein AB0I75_35715 [Streptomyces sp. NPDC050273]|uniref:hypothetical protein n=1 Tax=Streptomyces sp. NPDC050273 TaxID=3154933 RepID=UPI003418F167
MSVRVDSNSQLTPEQERVYRLRNAAERDGGTPGGFLELLAAVVADETWRQIPSGVSSSEPFSSFAEFIEAKPPFGLGQRVEDVHVLLQMQHPHEAAAEFRSKMNAMRSEVRRLLAQDGVTGYSEQQRDRDIQAWAALDKSGSWWLAFFVVCQVRPQSSGSTAQGGGRATKAKISANEFARRAGTSADRVLRYYKAWEAARSAGAVVHSADQLFPGHEPVELPPAEDWTLYYSSRRSASTDRGALISAAAEAEGIRPTKALEVAENPTALRAAILADPRTADAARTALKALTMEERRSEHLEYVRAVAEEGKAQAASGQLIELPEQIRAQVSEQLASVADAPTDPDLVTSAYDLVQELVKQVVEADPEAHATEQRARFQTALKATRRSIAAIDPASLPDVVDDGLREEIGALQKVVNDLVASIARHE